MGGAEEETKETASDSQDEKQPEKRPQFKKPLTRDSVQAYSRWLHRNTPENHYFKVKIPWKTILIAFVFLVVGTILLYIGFSDMAELGNVTEVWEKLILGFILFIPGSFHTFLAIQALRGVPGWDYQDLTVFESESYFNDD